MSTRSSSKSSAAGGPVQSDRVGLNNYYSYIYIDCFVSYSSLIVYVISSISHRSITNSYMITGAALGRVSSVPVNQSLSASVKQSLSASIGQASSASINQSSSSSDYPPGMKKVLASKASWTDNYSHPRRGSVPSSIGKPSPRFLNNSLLRSSSNTPRLPPLLDSFRKNTRMSASVRPATPMDVEDSHGAAPDLLPLSLRKPSQSLSVAEAHKVDPPVSSDSEVDVPPEPQFDVSRNPIAPLEKNHDTVLYLLLFIITSVISIYIICF